MTTRHDRLIPTRWSLISRLKDWDDRASWKDFFDIYWKLIYGVAIKAGLTDVEAEEVVQETVITVAKHINDFKTDPARGSFKGWLLRVTQSRVGDQFRKRSPPGRSHARRNSRASGTGTAERVPDPVGNQLESIWDAEWEKNLVDAALERIKQRVSPRQYQIFYLNVVKKFPAQRVARVLGVNAAQVYLAKYRVGGLVKREIRILEKKLI
ncbi:MAG: RNA polymerase subunit sigma [Verrucomicrobia bacterium]|nr:MAG: RNA polymerase subunit sigma [Verrucomicrobiota bacterium]